MAVRSNIGESFEFSNISCGDLFEIHYAFVNEDSRVIYWNVIECASIDELSRELVQFEDSDLYVKLSAPRAWYRRNERAERLALSRRVAEIESDDTPF